MIGTLYLLKDNYFYIMNNKILKLQLKNADHSKKSRLHFALLIQENTSLLPKLLRLSQDASFPLSYKAMWVIEFVCRENLLLFLPHFSDFIKIIPSLKIQSAIRPAAKILEYFMSSYYVRKDEAIIKTITQNDRENIISICFDWLINPTTKVATKAYSMSILYWLGKEFTWIYPELKLILNQHYQQESAAYKARARMVLKKIN